MRARALRFVLVCGVMVLACRGAAKVDDALGERDGGVPEATVGDSAVVDSGTADVVAAQVATPTFTPAAGTYGGPQVISLATATPGATIHFTVDGPVPATTSPAYDKPFDLSHTSTVRAIATAPGLEPSAVASASYEIDIEHSWLTLVVFAPPAGAYPNPVDLVLSMPTAPADVICFTLNGLQPGCVSGSCTTGTVYDAGSPIRVEGPADGGAVVVKAIGCAAGSSASDITTATYTFPPP